jgi:hypothetical protein
MFLKAKEEDDKPEYLSNFVELLRAVSLEKSFMKNPKGKYHLQ